MGSGAPSHRLSASRHRSANSLAGAVIKNNGMTEFAIRGGDATKGTLGTFYKGALPKRYGPMKKQGGLVLGRGDDCFRRISSPPSSANSPSANAAYAAYVAQALQCRQGLG